MRSSWTALRRSLITKYAGHQARAALGALARRHAEFSAFDTPQSVITYCHGAPLEAADRVIARLARCVQRREHLEFASLALWLALWPGLSAIYDRRLRYFEAAPDELVSSIGASFGHSVESFDPSRVQHVSGTLVRNTERGVMDDRKREWLSSRRRASLDLHADEREFHDLVMSPDERLIGARRGTVADVIAGIAGDDAELVFAVALLGESQREAGLRLGLTHAATRQRFHRAVARVREELEGAVSPFA